jgi:HSP20 family molecular chaperone IbpA
MANAVTHNETAVRVFPAVDIYEGEKDYLLVLDVPGIDGSGIEVEVDKDVLKVGAKRSDGSETQHYQREFKIPPDVDGGAVSANAKDGVLRLVLPKHENAQPKRIAVATH